MLSSSGALVSEAQPDTNQATASALIMIFIGLLGTDKVEKRVILLPQQPLAVALRVDCGIWQSCYNCDLGSPPTVFKRAVAEFAQYRALGEATGSAGAEVSLRRIAWHWPGDRFGARQGGCRRR
jgi:hypothetical protein